ncbi:MAG: hypothetical protein MZU84_01255 [Sphingobacterium sp.]|nr:hypothetical protein [Sphingobacterium sp.]
MDPYASQRILTRDDFLAFFEERGVEPGYREDELPESRARQAGGRGVMELKIPILFQEYVVGFVHILNRKAWKAPFDLGVLTPPRSSPRCWPGP